MCYRYSGGQSGKLLHARQEYTSAQAVVQRHALGVPLLRDPDEATAKEMSNAARFTYEQALSQESALLKSKHDDVVKRWKKVHTAVKVAGTFRRDLDAKREAKRKQRRCFGCWDPHQYEPADAEQSAEAPAAPPGQTPRGLAGLAEESVEVKRP